MPRATAFNSIQRRSAVWTSRMAFFRILSLHRRWPIRRRPLFLSVFCAFWRWEKNDLG